MSPPSPACSQFVLGAVTAGDLGAESEQGPAWYVLGLSYPVPCAGQGLVEPGPAGWVGRRAGSCTGSAALVAPAPPLPCGNSVRHFPEPDWLRAGMETKSHKYLWTRGFKIFWGVIWLRLDSSVQLLIDAVRKPWGAHPWMWGWSAVRGARDWPGVSQHTWGLLWLLEAWDANGNWDSDGNCGSWLLPPSCRGDDGCAGAPGHLPTQLLRHSTVGKNSNNWLEPRRLLLLLHGGKQEYLTPVPLGRTSDIRLLCEGKALGRVRDILQMLPKIHLKAWDFQQEWVFRGEESVVSALPLAWSRQSKRVLIWSPLVSWLPVQGLCGGVAMGGVGSATAALGSLTFAVLL